MFRQANRQAYRRVVRAEYSREANGPESANTSRNLQQHYLPNVLFQISEKESELPLLKDRYFDEETLIYVCENKVCLRPTKTVAEALKQINN